MMKAIKDGKGAIVGIMGESGHPIKVFYSGENHLMTEHQDLIDAQNSYEIPKEINTLEKMNLYAKEHGGVLFYPVNSIADFKKDLHVNQESILANCTTKIFFKKEE